MNNKDLLYSTGFFSHGLVITYNGKDSEKKKEFIDIDFVLFLVAKSIQLFVTPWTVAHQAPLSTGFPNQDY